MLLIRRAKLRDATTPLPVDVKPLPDIYQLDNELT